MPNLIITSKGERYRTQLNDMFHSKSITPSQEDDWDVLYEMDYRIARYGSITDDHVLAMPDRGQGLGSLMKEDPGHWMAEETRDEVRATMRRLFEEGYIEYA